MNVPAKQEDLDFTVNYTIATTDQEDEIELTLQLNLSRPAKKAEIAEKLRDDSAVTEDRFFSALIGHCEASPDETIPNFLAVTFSIAEVSKEKIVDLARSLAEQGLPFEAQVFHVLPDGRTDQIDIYDFKAPQVTAPQITHRDIDG